MAGCCGVKYDPSSVHQKPIAEDDIFQQRMDAK